MGNKKDHGKSHFVSVVFRISDDERFMEDYILAEFLEWDILTCNIEPTPLLDGISWKYFVELTTVLTPTYPCNKLKITLKLAM